MTDTEKPGSTRERFIAAMVDVSSVGKTEQAQMGRNGSFKFRGIDAVMNAVGPAFREHGLMVMPEVLEQAYDRVPRANGGLMASTRVKVRYTILSPAEDTISGVAVGESNDTADKATAKAMSVAFRTFLLQSMVLPTDEEDPDRSYEELGRPQQDPPPDPGRLIYRQPDFDPHTVDKDTLKDAIKQAQQVRDQKAWTDLMRIGKSRFAPPPIQKQDPNTGAGYQPAPDDHPDENPWANAPETGA